MGGCLSSHSADESRVDLGDAASNKGPPVAAATPVGDPSASLHLDPSKPRVDARSSAFDSQLNPDGERVDDELEAFCGETIVQAL